MVQQSKITKDTLKYYFDRGLELIPINKQHGKRPLHNQWTKRKYTKKEIWNYAKKGYALGWRINSNHCVIDVDPRNNGKEGLRNLEKFLGIDDLSTVFPTIKTGGGGLHFYTSIKDKTKISEMSDMFEGVEFKCNGRQVLIPESIHPSGNFYEFDEWVECWEDAIGEAKISEAKIVHSSSLRMAIPEIICLKGYKNYLFRRPKLSRAALFKRDNDTSQYCGKFFHKKDLNIDHVLPQSRGGKNTWKNLVVSCIPCNNKKRNRTPEEAENSG